MGQEKAYLFIGFLTKLKTEKFRMEWKFATSVITRVA